MVKKITFNCDFKGKKIPINFYVGDPAIGSNPIDFQVKWLGQKGGIVPKEILDNFEKINNLAIKNHVAFEDLCQFVFDEVNSSKQINEHQKTVTQNQKIIENYLKENVVSEK